MGNRGFYKGNPAKRGKLQNGGTGEAGSRNRWRAAEKSLRLDHDPDLPARLPQSFYNWEKNLRNIPSNEYRFDNNFSAKSW